MSVDSGVSAPPAPGSTSRTAADGRGGDARRPRGAQRADEIADAVSTPSFRSRRDRPRAKGRRVRRVVRRIELWSVLKIALVFNTVMLGIALGTVAVLWGLANTTGLIADLEGFLRDSGFEDFRFEGDRMFRRVAFIGAVAALAASVFAVLSAALLNLISELTGGIRFVVIEEIVEAPAAPAAAVPAALPAQPPASPPVSPASPTLPVAVDTGAAPPARPAAARPPRPASGPARRSEAPAGGPSRPRPPRPAEDGPERSTGSPGKGPSSGKRPAPRPAEGNGRSGGSPPPRPS